MILMCMKQYEFTEVSILEDREERVDSITYSWSSMIGLDVRLKERRISHFNIGVD